MSSFRSRRAAVLLSLSKEELGEVKQYATHH
jgi:hypothetical protein